MEINDDLYIEICFCSTSFDQQIMITLLPPLQDEGVSKHTRSSWPTRLRHVLEAVIMGLTVVRMNNGQGLLRRAQVAGAWEA